MQCTICEGKCDFERFVLFLFLYLTQNYFLIARMLSFFVTFSTKVLYLIFCDKMRQFLIKEMDKEGGNKTISDGGITVDFCFLKVHTSN